MACEHACVRASGFQKILAQFPPGKNMNSPISVGRIKKDPKDHLIQLLNFTRDNKVHKAQVGSI